MNLKHTYCENFLSSDCFNTNIYGHQKLHHPISPKILWYVAYVDDCLNGMALQDEDDQTILQNYEIKNSTNENDKNNDLEKNNNFEISRIESELKNEKEIQNLEYEYNTGNETIKILPNPVNSSFKINSKNEISDLKLLNLWGKEVLNNIELNETISIEHLSSGVYYLVFNTMNNQEYYKIIKL